MAEMPPTLPCSRRLKTLGAASAWRPTSSTTTAPGGCSSTASPQPCAAGSPSGSSSTGSARPTPIRRSPPHSQRPACRWQPFSPPVSPSFSPTRISATTASSSSSTARSASPAGSTSATAAGSPMPRGTRSATCISSSAGRSSPSSSRCSPKIGSSPRTSRWPVVRGPKIPGAPSSPPPVRDWRAGSASAPTIRMSAGSAS